MVAGGACVVVWGGMHGCTGGAWLLGGGGVVHGHRGGMRGCGGGWSFDPSHHAFDVTCMLPQHQLSVSTCAAPYIV